MTRQNHSQVRGQENCKAASKGAHRKPHIKWNSSPPCVHQMCLGGVRSCGGSDDHNQRHAKQPGCGSVQRGH